MALRRLGCSRVCAVLLHLLLSLVRASSDASDYVIVSQPRLGAIVYFKVNTLTHEVDHEPKKLVASGLKQPFGVTVDQSRQQLYVADAASRKVFMYKLVQRDGELSTDGYQYTIMKDLTPRWVTVDEEGTLFSTDEDTDEVLKMSARKIDREENGAEILYKGSTVDALYNLGGIAADGHHIFWTNKAKGHRHGTIARGLEEPVDKSLNRKISGRVSALASHVDTSYGMCHSKTTVYYAAQKKHLYSFSKLSFNKGAVSVLDNLVEPRGCSWDGDGTMYVADRGANSIWTFPSELQRSPEGATKLLEVENPYGVAVLRTPQNAGLLSLVVGRRDQQWDYFTKLAVTLLSMAIWFTFSFLVAVYYFTNMKSAPLDEQYIDPALTEQSEWRYRLLGCFEEPMLCVFSCFCGHVQWSHNMHSAGIIYYWVAFMVFSMCLIFQNATMGISGMVLLSLLVYFRQRLREKFGLNGFSATSIFEDCCIYLWCGACAIVQDARQIEYAVKASGGVGPLSTMGLSKPIDGESPGGELFRV